MAEPAVIVVPMMPPQECSPNHHGHWRTRHAAAAEFRECGRLCAIVWASAVEHEWAIRGADAVVMDIAVAWAGRRKAMDTDNLIAACKPLRDGIADALWSGEDQHVRVGEITQTRGEGVTVLTLREVLR
jgi:hypothetical protein